MRGRGGGGVVCKGVWVKVRVYVLLSVAFGLCMLRGKGLDASVQGSRPSRITLASHMSNYNLKPLKQSVNAGTVNAGKITSASY